MTARKFSSRLIYSLCLCLLVLFSLCLGLKAFSWKNSPDKRILENGLTIIYQQDTSSALTVLQIVIMGGKGAEPLDKSGLAYLTTHLMLEIPDFGKAQDLMSQASTIYMMGKADYSLINLTCLSENLEGTLKIVSQIMLKPLFSGIRIDRTKERMVDQKKVEEDEPIQAGHYAVLEKLFSGSRYGGPVLGSKESLRAIKKKDIENFYETYLRAGNMIAVVISDLEKESLYEIINKYLGELPSGKPTDSEPSSVSMPEEEKISIERETKQYLICYGFPLPEITSRNLTLALMLENLLGKGVDSKLWPLRIKEKLAYNVNCVATQMRDAGVLEAYLETDKEKKERALESLKRVLDELYETGISEEELKVTKINLKSAFLRNNETKGARASTLASFQALGLGFEFFNGFFQEIDSVSLEDMNAYIKDILNPEKGLQIIVGPKEKN